jgi:hypothetical protein
MNTVDYQAAFNLFLELFPALFFSRPFSHAEIVGANSFWYFELT